MTKQRALGNNALEAVNQASELANEASDMLEPVAQNQSYSRAEINGIVALAIVKIQKALRHLEKVGAKTRP